jgi:serine O-acetyltransferase
MPIERPGMVESWRRLRRDYAGFRKIFNKQPGLGSLLSACLSPSMIAIAMHRAAHFFYSRGWTLVSDGIYLLAFLLTGAEISPASRIGGGLVIFHTTAVAIHAVLGQDVVVTSRVVMGTDGGTVDVGAGPGLPVVGSGVYIGANCLVLGPRRVGDHAVLYANSLITRDIPEGGRVFGIPGRVINAARLARGRQAKRGTFSPISAGSAPPEEAPAG